MTTITLIRSRNPLEALSMNSQPQLRRSKRPKPQSDGDAYDEADGDFKFTRKAKRTKTETQVSKLESASRSRRSGARHDEELSESSRAPKRQMNISTPKQDVQSKAQPRRGLRRSTRLSGGGNQEAEASTNGTEAEVTEMDGVELVGASTAETSSRAAANIPNGATKIALPFSDTPVITRNKELRKTGTGRRRSSLGLRGRRASSLIDNGHSAIPHHQVETSHFYKHIESDGLSEPRRMKQLLIWCGERALGPKPAHNMGDNSAIMSARLIQEAILKDFSSRSEMSDWFNREITPRAAANKRPNPANISNAVRIEELEERLKRLRAQRSEWQAISRMESALPPLLDPSGAAPSPSELDASLLEPEGAEMLAALSESSSTSLAASLERRLRELQAGLEFKVDHFADGIHKLGQARQTMDRAASKVLALSAARLEERERRERTAVGTRDLPIQDVLRSLSRIMPSEDTTG
ncbi:MAG: hypothetical protein M1818_004119 [Claussenomyces sp. TS43310]|nr:MAG: hypothetical protein M1818_004119 [Claussenomyces sp. TS43310]